MLNRSVSMLALAGACCALSPTVVAQSSPAAPAQAGALDAQEVRDWLMRIHEAASRRNFQGTFVVSAGGSVSSARIAHYCDGRNQVERVESLDGAMRRVFRDNNTVHTLWPQSKLALIEQRELMSSFPALLQQGDHRIVDFYNVRSMGQDRVAGLEANVLQVSPKDAHRFGYRLWADRQSGLLLRAEVLGERDDVLESAAFSDVVVNVKPQFAAVRQGMTKLDGYRVLRPTLSRTRLEDEGWTLVAPVAGFRSVSCVKRPLLADPTVDTARVPEVVQSIYSDGLTYVSVFIEPFDAARHSKPVQTALGATHTLMRRQGEWWVTVVGDVPMPTLKLFVNALTRRKP
jgi:sigma-E factor negative regulatory protein RseB